MVQIIFNPRYFRWEYDGFILRSKIVIVIPTRPFDNKQLTTVIILKF